MLVNRYIPIKLQYLPFKFWLLRMVLSFNQVVTESDIKISFRLVSNNCLRDYRLLKHKNKFV